MEIRLIRRAKRKRITKQVRVVTDLHEKLSKKAKEQHLTLSKMLEKICHQYFTTVIEKRN